MMTPSRKASRATVITVSIAIGVFGAGAGLGTVIAARSHPGEGQVLRLAAGTYHLADGERAWKSRGASGSDQGVPLSGANEGSTIAKKKSKDPRLCLTATADGHAVGGGAAGCVDLPAVLAGAAAPLQRPGNPRSTGAAPPKKASSAPEPRRSTAAQPAPDNRRTAAQPDPAPRRTAAQPPPARPIHSEPSPTQTKKIAGDISESGSLVEKPAEPTEKKRDVNSAPKEPTPKSAPPSETSRPEASPSTVQPTPPPNTATPTTTPGTAEPSRPTATPGPSHTHRDSHRPGTPTPSSTLQPAQPSSPVTPSPDTQLPTPDPDTQLPSPDQNPTRTPDGTVLRTAQPPSPNGEITENGDSLPIFQDPELLRRAQEALGLDKNMRYTDENGVWDLNIAPPGTPPCRNYSAAELQQLDSPQSGSPSIPRDSCQWPAFIRWLYAEPSPGEVSNWTKFTGLPERNLELVVTDPSSPLPPAPAGTSQVEPDTGQTQPDTNQIQPDTRQTQPDTNQIQPDTNQIQPDTNQIQPDTGQVQPDPFGYNDQ